MRRPQTAGSDHHRSTADTRSARASTLLGRSSIVALAVAALIAPACADAETESGADHTALLMTEPLGELIPVATFEAANSHDSIMEVLFLIFRQSIEETNEDKKYHLSKLARYNDMGDALSAYLSELVDVSRKLEGQIGEDWEWRDSDLNGYPDLFEEIDGVPNMIRDDNWNGTPDLLEDSDGDGIPNPLEDDDQDSIANQVDRCPQEVGDAANHGCPADVTASTTNLALLPTAVGTYGDYELVTDFSPDPITFELPAGGPVDLARPLGCTGWTHSHPSLRLHWTGTDLLQLYYLPTDRDVDTVLVVNHPTGDWTCRDDSYDTMHPTITINPSGDGTYAIWVASHTQGVTTRGTLHVTEFANQHP